MKRKSANQKSVKAPASTGKFKWVFAGVLVTAGVTSVWLNLDFKDTPQLDQHSGRDPELSLERQTPDSGDFESVIAHVTDYEVVIHAKGELDFERSSVVAEVDGKVAEVGPSFHEGRNVNPGQILLRLDARKHLLALAEANATVRRLEAEMRLDSAHQRGLTNTVKIAETKLARATARWELENSLAKQALREKILRLQDFPSGNATLQPTADDLVAMAQEQTVAVEKTLTEARKTLTWANANPTQARSIYQDIVQNVRDAEAEVLAAEDAVEATRLSLRLPQLWEARLAMDTARAEHDKALLDLAELSSARKNELQSRLATARIHALRLEDNLENVQISTPPSSVRIHKTHVTAGDNVAAGQTVAEVFNPLRAVVALSLSSEAQGFLPPADHQPSMKGSDVTLIGHVDGIEATWNGRIVRGENKDGQAIVSVTVDDPYHGLDSGALLMGLPITARIQGSALRDVFLIPLDGLTQDDEIWLADSNGKFQPHPVEILWRDHRHAITRGVWKGETVLHPGDTIGIPKSEDDSGD